MVKGFKGAGAGSVWCVTGLLFLLLGCKLSNAIDVHSGREQLPPEVFRLCNIRIEKQPALCLHAYITVCDTND